MSSVEAVNDSASEVVPHKKERLGVVVSAKSTNTVIVKVERRVRHPKYKKFLTDSKRFAVHDVLGCSEGDRVRIQETRPVSKTKRWRVVERLGANQ